MANSLLAHLYSHIKGSQEDVATLSLQYIVSSAPKLNREFTRLLSRALCIDIGSEELNYSCQSVGKNQERPDISGVDVNGKEQVLCEAKFYAGLTENQPNGYIDRLKKEDALGLVFICPAARKTTLWSKLLDLCKERSIVAVEEFCVAVDNVRMSIITWSEIVDSLQRVASSEVPDAVPDIFQLDGFCKMMDRESFIPFSDEDFGPISAIKEERHYQVLDEVFNLLISDKTLKASSKGLKATAYRNGYVRYIRVLGHALSINYDRRLWRAAGSEETPFWVEIMSDEFKQPSEYSKAFSRYPKAQKETLNDGIALALYPPTNAALDEVAAEIASQIVTYINELEDSLK